MQSQDAAVEVLGPVTRAAVNLRGVPADAVHRGDVLLSPGAWSLASVVDVRGLTGESLDEAPRELTAHVGTAAVPATVRPLGETHARLTLARALPLTLGDRMLLRAPGDRAVYAGVQVLDLDPPELARRGDARRRAEQLAAMRPEGDLTTEVRRRGAVLVSVLGSLGLEVPGDGALPAGVRRVRDVLVDEERLASWAQALGEAVRAELTANPLSPGLTGKAAVDRLGLPDLTGAGGDAQQGVRAASALLSAIVREAELTVDAGRIRPVGAQRSMGAAEPAIAALEDQWTRAPFRAPEARDLDRLRLGARELAAAEAQGRLVRLGGQDARGGAGARGGTAGQGDPIVLGPGAPSQAMRILAGLPQPFTTSQARQALDTTRRTVIPLLEHLDARGWTTRLDAGHREVVRS
jgi:selenocysteine-specific elongation factor